MRELRFDGLSPDGTRLVLAGNDGQRYTVAIDERLEAAVRRDRARMSQVELEQSGMLRPREIQARIRAGATAEDVAAASGLPLERVRRFEGPVLTERAWVAQQAQATEVRRPGGDVELGRLVSERLAELGVDDSDILWDAWRRDDGLWVVIATFPVPPNTHVATWTYDSGGRTMTVADDNARALSSNDPGAPLELASPARPALAAVSALVDQGDDAEPSAGAVVAHFERTGPSGTDESHPTEESEPTAAATGSAPADESELTDDELELLTRPEALDPAEPGQPDEAPVADASAGPTADAEDVPLFETPRPPAPKPAGRPHVPSFDDILFGPGRPQ